MFVYCSLLVVAILAMISLKRCSNQGFNNDFGMVKSSDTVYVAIEYSPLSLYMYDDTLGGFNNDLLKLIERKENVSIKMIPVVSLSESLAQLEDGKYDILAAQVPVTAEFREKYIFSDSIYLDKQVLVQKRDTLGQFNVKSQLDLAGETLCVVSGSPVVDRIKNLSDEIGDTIRYKLEEKYGQEQLFMMVATGDIKYAVISEKIAKTLSPNYPNVSINTAVSFNQFQSWILNKSNVEMRDSLNVWLNRVRQTEVYKDIYSKYFN